MAQSGSGEMHGLASRLSWNLYRLACRTGIRTESVIQSLAYSLGAAARTIALSIIFLTSAPSSAVVPDAGDLPTAHAPFMLPFEITDAVFDARRGMLYATSGINRTLYFVDLATGVVTSQFSFAWTPEHLSMTPDGSRLYVTLLTRDHSPYWYDGSHEGYIAGFDLDLQVKDRQFWIPEDPYGIAATSDGRLVISSGSGQWTHIHLFAAETGTLLGTAARSIRHLSHVVLHPSENAVYTSDQAISPADIHRWNIGPGGSITYAWDSIYHGDHRIHGKSWISPLGDLIISQGGDAFTAGKPGRDTDIQFLRSLTPGVVNAVAYDDYRNVIFTGHNGEISYYNLHSLEKIGTTTVAGDISYLGVAGNDLLGVQVGNGESRILVYDHPVPNGHLETPPSVAYAVVADGELTTRTDISFDASGSTDAEGGLVYRWDLDGDGVWDTGFSPDPVLVHRFDTAGTKSIRVQVKDTAGWVSEASFNVDIAFEPDPGSPGAPHPGFLFQFPVTDVVFDPVRPYMYVTSLERKQLHFINTGTGFIEKSFSFTQMPENLAITPDGSRLYVGLLTRPHSPYWWNDEHEGYIASFDLDLQVKDRQFLIQADPYDLLATGNGQVVVSSGSGQSTYVSVFNGVDGALLGTTLGVYHGTRLALYPDESIIYAADNGLSPSDIERIDLDITGQVTYRWDSVYHGDHRMSGNIWASPLGDVVITRGGDVFSVPGADRTDDMAYLRGLTPGLINSLAYDAQRRVIFTGHDGEIGYYNIGSFEQIGSVAIAGDIRFLGARDLQVYAVLWEPGQARLVRLDHPVPDGDIDTPPVAALVAKPAGKYTTMTDIELDASGSTDAEGLLQYRWDLNGDGVWDTNFTADPVLVHRYSTAGPRTIRLQVKDSAANVDEQTLAIDVTFEPDPGMPGEVHPAFELPFSATDTVFDPVRPYAYVTSLDRRALYIVNLESGFIERSFSFDVMPERMTITPNGSRLYVALLTRLHSPYWWKDEHEGYFASFDLDRQVKDGQFRISMDPYDLVARDDGALVITSGSGQWTDIGVYDGNTGVLQGIGFRSIRERSSVALHPDNDRIYVAGGSSYPQDVRRWDFDAIQGIKYAYDSIYHGHHRVGDDLWISPRGDVLVTSGGDVYKANGNSRNTDIIYQHSLPVSGIQDIVWSPLLNEFAVITASAVQIYDMKTYADLESFTLQAAGRSIGRRGPLLYAAQTGAGGTRLEVLVHGNRIPVASPEPVPESECDGTHGRLVRLDGSGSHDVDSIEGVFEDIVSYEWFDVDAASGEWIRLGRGAVLEVPLSLGLHDIRLRVTDHAGEAGTAAVAVTITDTTPPVAAASMIPVGEIEDHGGWFRIETSCTDTCSTGTTITSSLNDYPVSSGQLVKLEKDDNDDTEERTGILKIKGDEFELVLSCQDESGNATTVFTTPIFDQGH